MHVYCDFDGTVTTADTTDLVLTRCADPAWRDLEDEWLEDRISAAECMRRQVRTIRGSRSAIDSVLDTVALRPGFSDFVLWCRSEGIPLTLVSDGVDAFIQRILARHRITGLAVVANSLRRDATGWSLDQPWRSSACGARQGVCKCATVTERLDQGPLVYIGDGRSDFCVSLRADLIFARASLAEYLEASARPFTRYTTFHDIAAVLARTRASKSIVPRVA